MKRTPPKFLGPEGKRKWRSLLKQLGTIKESEADSLSLLCASWEDFLAARNEIKEQGHYLLSAVNGRKFINPAVNERNEAWKQIVKLSKGFGLAPELRQDKGLDAGDGDKWGDLLGAANE